MKNDDVQQVRQSQFILSLGPGAIIESVNGPRLIPSLRSGLGDRFTKYVKSNEIKEVRLKSLFDKEEEDSYETRFFRLPTNSAEGKKENQGIYNTIIFPSWNICYNKKHKNSKAILYNSLKYDKCPDCGDNSANPVRFISACPDGHLDDIYWTYVVHDDNECYNEEYFYWDADGSSLSNIKIECPKCGNIKSMQDIYKKSYNCTGRTPEKEVLLGWGACKSTINRKGNCNRKMKVVQRQSTSLRLVKTMTLLKIPEYSSNIIEALTYSGIKAITKVMLDNNMGEETYLTMLDSVGNENHIKNIKNYIKDNSYEDLLEFAQNLYESDKSYEDVVLEEFELLKQDSSINKNVLSKKPSKKYNVDINGNNFEFKVAAVDKITSVTAQKGYQRRPYMLKEYDENGEEKFIEHSLVSSGEYVKSDNEVWYPAVESEGEGIFITSDMNPIDDLDLTDIAETWIKDKPLYKTNENYKNPIFVWWHSFSHMIIKKLAYDSGYSEASIRERVYFDSKTGKGGVLLYTSSGGEDCSLGGLIELSADFGKILEESFKMMELCSSDPICLDSYISSEKVNGAACVYCLFLSETSCEHNNMWLDRHLLLNK